MSADKPGLGEGVAADLDAQNRSISIAEFFEKNKHMLGFDSGARGLVTAVKEAVDNALDACSDARIFPDITVKIEEVGDYYRLTVIDNGPGITKEQIPKVFGKLLYGSRFAKREMSRGQQGIGISAAVLYSQLTSGKPAKITSTTGADDTAKFFELTIDTDTNEPEIRTERETEWDQDHGTKIELEMEANLRSRQQLHDYIKYTAVVNPYARIEFTDPRMDGMMVFDRSVDELPDPTEEIKPHPHGVELGTLKKMLEVTDSYSLSGFLESEFTRVGSKSAEKILNEFRDREYGREVAWPVAADGDAIVDAATEAVNGKTKDATAAFAESLADRLTAADAVSYETLTSIVDDVADDVEDTHQTRFGGTVRENAVDAVWPVVRSPESMMKAVADDATSTRKDDQDVLTFAARLADTFADGTDRDRYKQDDLRSRVDRAADRTEEQTGTSFGDTVRENAVDELWSRMNRVPDDVPKTRNIVTDRDQVSNLLDAMSAVNVHAPSADCLSPIGEEAIENGLKTVFDGAEFYTSSTRSADVHSGDPFIVESGIAYGGDLEDQDTKKVETLRFANRVPLVYARGGCAITSTLKDINWNTYKLSQPGGGLPQEPAVIVVHVASTNVPFTSESKDAVASVPEIEDEIEQAVRESARDLRSHLKEQRRLEKQREKEDVIGRILPSMAEKLGGLLDVENPPEPAESTARIMNNVYVTADRDNSGDVTLTVRNYGNSGSETFTVAADVDGEPTGYPTALRTEGNDDGWTLLWEDVSISAGDELTATFSLPEDASVDLTLTDIPTEKVTLDD